MPFWVRVGACEIEDLIVTRKEAFKQGRGMVLVLQEDRRVRVFFFNGVSRFSWNYTNYELNLDRIGQATQEGPPVKSGLRQNEVPTFISTLRSRFWQCDTTIQSLWKLNPNARDYEAMKAKHQHELGMRISFG